MRNVIIRGTGSYLPPQVVRNDDFSSTLETSDEWIRTRTGIRERRFAGPRESSLTMAVEASRSALEAAELTPSDIDLIVFATVTPDAMVPQTACRLQGLLGCRPIGAFDLNGACSGFIQAFATGVQFIKGEACRNVLVVGSEVLSRTLNYADRTSCVLFGDGAGAVVLSASDDSQRGVRWIRMYSDGNRGELIQLASQVTNRIQTPFTPVGSVLPPPYTEYLWLNGRQVFQFAVETMGRLIRESMNACSLTPDQVALVVPHQVNQRIIDTALKDVVIPSEKLMINIDRYGNTAAASVPIALDEAVRQRRVHQGDTILLVAFGGGLSWCSVVVTL
jgi:3-oxoacyl-[acyl-carrier-protein] synthase-3